MAIGRKGLFHIISGMILVFLCGCTTLHSYNLEQLDADIPLQPHDRITVFLNDPQFTRYELFVVSVNPDTLYGRRVENPEQGLSLRWDEIGRIEARKFDGRKTATWAVVIGLILIAIGDAAADFFDGFGEYSSSN